MIKYFSGEFNKDDRDYRRFFQSRNVSLPTFMPKPKWYDPKKSSGKKFKFYEDTFFPLIAKKMIQKA